MAEATLEEKVLGGLRRYSWVYRSLRFVWRRLRAAPEALLRQRIPRRFQFGFARGFFSAAQQVREGKIDGRILLEAQPCEPFPADSLVRQCGLRQDEFQPWPIFWAHHHGARLIGQSLAHIDRKRRLCAEATFSQQGEVDDPAYRYWMGRTQQLSGAWTSVVSRWGHLGYWHWLMDALPRLALVPEFPADTGILVPPLRPWMTWFLDRLEVTERCRQVTSRDITIEEFFFAAPTAMTGCHNPFAIRFLRDHFLKFRSSCTDSPRRFFILREGFTRGIRNPEDVHRVFTERGWPIIAPERLSIPEQISLFAGAERIVALHGSALANLVWCSPGARVLEITAAGYMAGAFEIVARTLGLRHSFMLCRSDSFHRVSVDTHALEVQLDLLDQG